MKSHKFLATWCAGKILSGENSKGLTFSGAHALFPGMCAENKRKKEIFAHFKEILKGSIQEPLKWSNFQLWDWVDCTTQFQTLSTCQIPHTCHKKKFHTLYQIPCFLNLRIFIPFNSQV